MPLLPLLSHQKFSDQSTIVQQMVGLQFRRCRALNSKHSQTSSVALQGCATWKVMGSTLTNRGAGHQGTPVQALHYLQGR